MFVLALLISGFVGCNQVLRRIVSAAVNDIRTTGTDWEDLVDTWAPGMTKPTDSCEVWPGDDEIGDVPVIWKVGTGDYYYYLQNFDSVPTGLTVDTLDAIIARTNSHYADVPGFTDFSYELVEMNDMDWFNSVVAALNAGSIDFQDCMKIIEIWKQDVSFTCAYATESTGLIRSPASKGFVTVSNISDSSVTIVAVDGNVATMECLDTFPEANFDYVASPDEMYPLLVDETYQIGCYKYELIQYWGYSACTGCDLVRIQDIDPSHLPYGFDVGWGFAKPVCPECNDGVCNSLFECNCSGLVYSGESCSEVCECDNGGTCDSSTTCDCSEAPIFGGQLCDVCLCDNDGTCEESLEECVCPEGFEGTLCETESGENGSNRIMIYFAPFFLLLMMLLMC